MADAINHDESCVFCKIIKGEIPCNKVYEDELCLAFRDIAPQTPVHILVVPKEHITSVADIDEESAALVGHIFAVIAKIVADEGITGGFRVTANSGADARQSVPHLHFHILAGKPMSEKMA